MEEVGAGGGGGVSVLTEPGHLLPGLCGVLPGRVPAKLHSPQLGARLPHPAALAIPLVAACGHLTQPSASGQPAAGCVLVPPGAGDAVRVPHGGAMPLSSHVGAYGCLRVWQAMLFSFSGPKSSPLPSPTQDLAAFLLQRGPFAWIGYQVSLTICLESWLYSSTYLVRL